MQWRAALGQRFRRNDDQVNAALFDRLRLRRVQPVNSTTESVDLTTLDSLQYLLDGWIIRNQLHLTYGPGTRRLPRHRPARSLQSGTSREGALHRH